MMYGHEKSDLAIVAEKPTNKAERSAAEPVERRAGTKGNAGQLSTCRTQCRTSVTQGVGSHAATCLSMQNVQNAATESIRNTSLLQGYSPVRVPWVVSFFAALK
jgi:hypothetical protein